MGISPVALQHASSWRNSPAPLICLFGIGYAMVAMKTPGGRDIVILGLIGKLGVCVLVIGHLIWGHVPSSWFWRRPRDFLFAIAFAV